MRAHELQGVAEGLDKKEATRRIQKMLNTKFGANLDVDGVLGPLTLKSINKFMPGAKIGLADEPNKTTAVQGKQVKQQDEAANPAQQAAIAISMKKAGKKPKDVAEGSAETPQQQQVRAAITKGMAADKQTSKDEFQSRQQTGVARTGTPPPGGWWDPTTFVAGRLQGIDSIDPDGTVVIDNNSVYRDDAVAWVKRMATMGGMPGVRTKIKTTPITHTASSGMTEDRTEVKDKEGKVISWKDDSNWKPSTDKQARGRVTNMSDKARRETEKLKKDQQGVAEGDKIGNMDTGAYDSAMARLKQLAGAGPLKTVYDPATRRYKNVPSAVQPVQQPKKK